jgi:hypothetical protein
MSALPPNSRHLRCNSSSPLWARSGHWWHFSITTALPLKAGSAFPDLSTENSEDDALTTLIKIYSGEKANARAGTPNQYGLFLVTAREIYYVAGIYQLIDYVGDWGNRKRVPGAIESSLRDFQLGIDLIADVPNEIVVPFAKSYYGKALALRSRAAVNAAINKLGAQATSKQIDKQVSDLVEQRAPLPFTHAERAEFVTTIYKFLHIVDGRENEYLSPNHIKSLRKCRVQATYDCMHTE